MKKLSNFNDYKKIYEFEVVENLPAADKLSFMNKLKSEVEDFLKDYPKDFRVNYIPGKKLTIDTDREEDLKMVVRVEGDKINFDAKPTEGPAYEFNYGFNKDGLDNILGLIESGIVDDPNQGIIPQPKGKTYKYDTDEPSATVKEEEIEPLDIPITKKPIKRKRSININIIQDVLEDAYILEDIDLRDTSVEELIRRMLLESRKKTK